jgi:hypothetical protein
MCRQLGHLLAPACASAANPSLGPPHALPLTTLCRRHSRGLPAQPSPPAAPDHRHLPLRRAAARTPSPTPAPSRTPASLPRLLMVGSSSSSLPSSGSDAGLRRFGCGRASPTPNAAGPIEPTAPLATDTFAACSFPSSSSPHLDGDPAGAWNLPVRKPYLFFQSAGSSLRVRVPLCNSIAH